MARRPRCTSRCMARCCTFRFQAIIFVAHCRDPLISLLELFAEQLLLVVQHRLQNLLHPGFFRLHLRFQLGFHPSFSYLKFFRMPFDFAHGGELGSLSSAVDLLPCRLQVSSVCELALSEPSAGFFFHLRELFLLSLKLSCLGSLFVDKASASSLFFSLELRHLGRLLLSKASLGGLFLCGQMGCLGSLVVC